MSRALPWAIAVACVIALAGVLFRYHAEQTILVTVTQRESAAHKDAERAALRVRELQKRMEQQEQALAAAKAAAAAAARHAPPADGGPNAPFRISLDDMRKDPAFAGIWKRQQMRNIQRQYGDAIAAMKLPPDTEAKLRALMIERSEASSDARQVAADQGLSRTEQFRAEEAARQDGSAQIKALLGDDRYGLLEQGSQLSSAKMMMSFGVGSDLASSGVPLTPQQELQVAQVYAKQMRTPVPGSDIDPATGLNPRNLAIYNGTASILTPPQLSALKDSLAADQQQQVFIQQQRTKLGAAPGSGVVIMSTSR